METACLPSYSGWISSATSPQSTELLTEPLTVCAPGVSAAIPCVATPAAELEDPARGCLTPPRRRHAGAASDDTNLVVSQRFGSRVVDIPVRRDAIGIADRSARGNNLDIRTGLFVVSTSLWSVTNRREDRDLRLKRLAAVLDILTQR